jgi:ABC-type proline/glycine betaine transport system permease subunit
LEIIICINKQKKYILKIEILTKNLETVKEIIISILKFLLKVIKGYLFWIIPSIVFPFKFLGNHKKVLLKIWYAILYLISLPFAGPWNFGISAFIAMMIISLKGSLSGSEYFSETSLLTAIIIYSLISIILGLLAGVLYKGAENILFKIRNRK